MLKILKIKVLVFPLALLMGCNSIGYAGPQGSLQTNSQTKVKIGSEVWIEQKLRQYPELLWLTESGGAPLLTSTPIDMAYSEKLFNKKVPALDIAIRSMIHLHLLIQGSRQSYMQLSQILPSEEGGMTFKQFQTAHKQLLFFLNSPKSFDNTLRILETAIVLRHVGCSAKAVTTFKPYFTDSCPQSFYAKALHVLRTFPELCPSYARLSPEQQEVLLSLRRLGNYDSLLNLTEVPSAQLLSAWRTRRSLAILDLYLYCLDTCGDKNCSQEFYVNFAPLLSMLQQHATIEEAFSRYFTYRANRLGFEGTSRTDMTLVRLATLMNLSPSEASTLAWSFKNLPSDEAENLVNSFYTVQGEHIPLTFRGLPSLVAGLSVATHGSTVSPENRLRQLYSTMLSLLVKSLRSHREMLNKQLLPQGTVLDFSETTLSSGGLDVFAESIAVRIHLNGAVSINL
uniref:Putative lipoprotein n=1 Tax=Chlamydia pneumoniae TaxID=83558 RepID=A0A0F7WXB0_CHLPN|nr:Putative lipoprotein [Chlamydia pneumoniae]